MSTVVITATGTGIGKTHVTTQLLRFLRGAGIPARAIKPLLSGYDPLDMAGSDTGLLLAALGEAPTQAAIDAMSPFRYSAPLAPNMAARAEGRSLTLREIVAASQPQIAPGCPLLIEGVGGIMSPVTDEATCLDWIAALGCPALLVTGSYLGSLSHALTAASVLAARHIPLTAVVVNETGGATVSLADTCAELRRFLPGTPVLACPRGAGDAHPVFARIAAACGLA